MTGSSAANRAAGTNGREVAASNSGSRRHAEEANEFAAPDPGDGKAANGNGFAEADGQAGYDAGPAEADDEAPPRPTPIPDP